MTKALQQQQKLVRSKAQAGVYTIYIQGVYIKGRTSHKCFKYV